MAMPCRAASDGPVMVTGLPPTLMVPASAWYTPVRMRISVDLPAPFSPTSAWISPGRQSNDTPLRAFTPGKVLTMPSTDSVVSLNCAMPVPSAEDLLQFFGRKVGVHEHAIGKLGAHIGRVIILRDQLRRDGEVTLNFFAAQQRQRVAQRHDALPGRLGDEADVEARVVVLFGVIELEQA